MKAVGILGTCTALLAAMGVASAASLPVAPEYIENTHRSSGDVVIAAARFLADRQGTYANGNGDALVLEGWEWLVGSKAGAQNISGVVALGLLDAYEATGDEDFLAAAKARSMLAVSALERGEDVYAPDLELVARLAKASGDSEEMALARRGLDARLKKAGGPAGEVERILKLRSTNPNLTGYDVALVADAALAVGRVNVAQALLGAIREREKAWLRKPSATFAIISQGALLSVASRVGDKESAQSYALSLLAMQQEDGNWRTRETQATAYATRGLQAFAAVYGDSQARVAAEKGRAWLQLTQLKNGSWADYNDYLPAPFVGDVYAPATAEALRALVMR